MLAAALSWLLVLLARLLSTAAVVTDAAPRLSRDPGAFAHLCGSASPTRGRTECVNHAATVSRLVIVAAAEAANQVSYAEGNGGGRVWALLNGGAKEVLSPGGAFVNSFHGIRRRLLHLSIDILRGPFNLFCLALKLTFYVARSLSQSLFHPAPDVFGITDNAIFVHERDPSEIQGFQRLECSRFPFPARTDNINGL